MQPKRVGPWLIERKLGAGGMGTVYLGTHADSGKQAAVKVLPASLSREEGFVARFSREVDTMRKLRSPHIVEFYESGVAGSTFYFAMEFVDGETIADRLTSEKRLLWTTVIELTLQICSALKVAHVAGIIHRDLKPSNLLLTADGDVKLTDFGIAQVFAGTKLTATGGIIGTPEFMSPEQAEGRRTTGKSDLYSLGAVMYAMLTGRPPFTGNTTLDIIQKHRYGQFEKPRHLIHEMPLWLEEIVCQLLEKDPDKRFPDPLVLARRLQECLNRDAYKASQETGVIREYDGNAPTVTAPGAGGFQFGSGPGPGTLMRDLVRDEIEAESRSSPLVRFLNSTWVLLLTLMLLIAGGVYWFRTPSLSAQEKFDAGLALLEQPAGSDWLRARDAYFQPLLESDPQQWREKVEPHLQRIRIYELKSGLKTPRNVRGKSNAPQTEPERFLMLAQQYQQMGDLVRAERTYSALAALSAGDPDLRAVHELAKEQLAALHADEKSTKNRYTFVKAALKRAEKLNVQNKQEQARAICAGVIELYGDDPHARQHVERARRLLAEKGKADDGR